LAGAREKARRLEPAGFFVGVAVFRYRSYVQTDVGQPAVIADSLSRFSSTGF
jgi:hypothetical protein